MNHTARILAIGAGCKTVALGVNFWALRGAGFDTPDLWAVEQASVGANWGGRDGFTNGAFPVDTSPMKDLGFPYRTGFGAEVDRRLTQVSFFEYIRTTGQLEDWVNRGHPPLTHQDYAAYLRWASDFIGLAPLRARVDRITPTARGWEVSISDASGSRSISTDAVVYTGPGSSRSVPITGTPGGRVSDGRTIWRAIPELQLTPGAPVAVVGTGQSGATSALALREAFPQCPVDVVSSTGILPAQSAGYTENRMCSDPREGWSELDVKARQQFLRQVNNGVVEASLKARLDGDPQVRVRAGRVVRVDARTDGVVLELAGEPPLRSLAPYQHVVLALGFDPAQGLRSLLPEGVAGESWAMRLGEPRTMDKHFRVIDAPAPLHAPALAAMDWGPGAMLLSCLGTIAAGIASAYVSQTPANPVSATRTPARNCRNCMKACSIRVVASAPTACTGSKPTHNGHKEHPYE